MRKDTNQHADYQLLSLLKFLISLDLVAITLTYYKWEVVRKQNHFWKKKKKVTIKLCFRALTFKKEPNFLHL